MGQWEEAIQPPRRGFRIGGRGPRLRVEGGRGAGAAGSRGNGAGTWALAVPGVQQAWQRPPGVPGPEGGSGFNEGGTRHGAGDFRDPPADPGAG